MRRPPGSPGRHSSIRNRPPSSSSCVQQASRRKTGLRASPARPAKELTQILRSAGEHLPRRWVLGEPKPSRWPVFGWANNGQKSSCSPAARRRTMDSIAREVPNPLIIDISKGEADITVVLKDILSLTKLNYNTCIFGDGMPITLKFSDAIGEILTAGPIKDVPPLPFGHYI